ncbi:uncharacterized protein TNCV_107581 [Trichonephila clavipes]|nr:uncharacterized protein TNCV_107581 [Trichonephila clavipes]
MDADKNYLDYVVFSNESTFHLSGHVSTHNARIWSLENPHEGLESQRDRLDSMFLDYISRNVYGPFVFGKATIAGSAYLDALQLWLFFHLEEIEPDNFIWQQDGAPPH